MSIPTPTTKEVSDNIIAQLQSELNQTIPLLPKSFNRVLANALAAVIMILYKYAGWIFLQMFVARASNQDFEINGQIVNPLVTWGELIGAGRPEAATQATLLLDVTVLTQTGTLPAGTQLIGLSNGVTYLTIQAVALNAATVQAEARAVSDQAGGGGAGTIGNLPVGAIVEFANTQVNVQQTTTVSGATVTGADGETTEAYRQRVIELFQRRPQGGAYVDYGIWGGEPEGIARIFPYTGDPGEVDVYVQSGTEPDRVPTQAQLDAVKDSIEFDQEGLATRRPANAFVNVYPVTIIYFSVEIFGLTNVDDEVDTKADIDNALTDYFLDRAPFIPGYSLGVNTSNILQTEITGIVSTIVNSHGGFFTSVTLYFGINPLGAYTVTDGQLAELDEVRYL